jgi:hypothetical protein
MGRPTTASRTTFACLVLSLFLVCALAEYPLAVTAAGSRGPRSGLWIGWLALFSLSSCWLAAEAIFKLLGISRSGKTIEVRGRVAGLTEGATDDSEVVEVRISGWSRWVIWSQIVFVLLICLGMILILVLVPHSKMKGVGYAYGILAFFCSGIFFLVWLKDHAIARADASGILGHPDGLHFRRKFVPWSEVALCEIHTYYDTFGSPRLLVPILRGWRGQELISLNVSGTRFRDQERLVKYIRAKLPKSRDDFWE